MKLFHLVILCFLLSCDKGINSETLLNDLKTLSTDNMEGRKSGTEGNVKARNYILKRLEEIKAKPFNGNFVHPFSFESRRSKKAITGYNLLAVTKGETYPDKYIVISAHYDHIGIGKAVEKDSINNGADDNASGTSALLQYVSYFGKYKPSHSILFAFWDAEEMGLQGAKWFIKNNQIDSNSILININMDMISRNDKNELYVAGTHHYPYLKKFIKNSNKDIHIKLGHDTPDLGYNDWTMSSDHAPFHKAKIPFLYFGVEDHAGYHNPTDEFENITPVFFINSVNSILEITKNIDQQITLK